MGAGRSSSWPRRVLAVGCLIGVATVWFFLGPRFLGGPILYTVINGQSMEPVLVADDLALVRERADYQVGDAIAYRSRNLGGLVVLHRIVAREGDTFVTQGDNNDFLDSDRPREQDVLGKLWVDIPAGGIVFTHLRSPVGMAVAAVVIFGILGAFAVSEKAHRRRHRSPIAASSAEGARDAPPGAFVDLPGIVPSESRRPLRVAAAILGTCVVTSSAFMIFVVNWSSFRSEPRTVPFVQSGEFSYSASAPKGPAYAGTTVVPGDPVFLRLIDRLAVDFEYMLQARAEGDVVVTGRLDALVSSANGWQHRIQVAPARSSDGNLRLHGVLDLSAVGVTVARVERMTGMTAGPYTLTLVPSIRMVGTVAGQPVRSDFSPELKFALDEIQLTLLRTGELGEEADLKDVLEHTREETVSVGGLVPNPFTIAGLPLPLAAARQAAAVALVLFSIALICILATMFRRRPRDEAARIQARYGAMMVPVAEGRERGYDTVDVADIQTLVRLARQFDQPVMHQHVARGNHAYTVSYDGLVYRFSATALGLEGEVSLDDPVLKQVVATLPRRPDPSGPT